jgi:hypothetical protein
MQETGPPIWIEYDSICPAAIQKLETEGVHPVSVFRGFPSML